MSCSVVKGEGPFDPFTVTHERILETALGLFSTKGYLGATTREIARQAGIAEVTLFRHFPSKEKLLEEAITRYSILPSLRAFVPRALAMPYEDALAAMANILLDTLVQLKDWLRIMHAEVQRSPEKLLGVYHTFLDELFEVIASYFRELQQRGSIGSFDPELGARVFHAMFYCFFNIEEVLLRKQYRPTDREKAVREFVRMFVHGTGGIGRTDYARAS